MNKNNQLNKKSFISLLLIIFTMTIHAENIIFSANSMNGKSNDKNSTTELKGNAYILTSSMEIKADSIVLFGEDYRFIKATGNISGKNLETKMEFKSDFLDFDRTTKIAILSGNVSLIDTENSVTAKAQRIEYDQNKEIAILQIEINLTQKENECTGAYAIYYKKDQILEISGNAQVKQKKDTFRAQNIHFDMETEEITLGGNVKGSVTDTKETTTKESLESETKENKTTDSVESETKENKSTDSVESETKENKSTDSEESETKE